MHAGIHPRTDTPRTRHPQEQTPTRTRHPPGADPPGADPPGPGLPLRGVHAGRYGQQAGGTHPTGMHTCWFNDLYGHF